MKFVLSDYAKYQNVSILLVELNRVIVACAQYGDKNGIRDFAFNQTGLLQFIQTHTGA